MTITIRNPHDFDCSAMRMDFGFDEHGSHMDAPAWLPRGGHYGDVTSDGEAIVNGFNCTREGGSWYAHSLTDTPAFSIYDARMKKDTPIKNHGGKRAGSGRKALDSDGTVVTTIRLTAKQKASFEMLGGVQWLRGQLDLFAHEGQSC